MKLSNREAACVEHLAKGLSYDQAGAVLDISPRTVRYHIENAKRKLEAVNTCHLIALAITSKEIAPK